MSRLSNSRRRPFVRITLPRAERLHRLVVFLPETPRNRASILSELRIGLRTFYRELELLKRCGVKVRRKAGLYRLLATATPAEGRLPFPDPQLSFAEMAELARCDCPAGARLAGLLAAVTEHFEPSETGRKGARTRRHGAGQGQGLGGEIERMSRSGQGMGASRIRPIRWRRDPLPGHMNSLSEVIRPGNLGVSRARGRNPHGGVAGSKSAPRSTEGGCQ